MSENKPPHTTKNFAASVDVTAIVGNSIKSDIVHALDVGTTAIQRPTHYECNMEKP